MDPQGTAFDPVLFQKLQHGPLFLVVSVPNAGITHLLLLEALSGTPTQ
jgi:hypothetical protein